MIAFEKPRLKSQYPQLSVLDQVQKHGAEIFNCSNRSSAMPAFANVFPVLPGKSNALKAFCRTMISERSAEFESSERRFGITRETWLLERSSTSDRLIIYFEAENVLRALNDFAASNNPFDVWYKNQLKLLTGVDFSEASDGQLPEQILSFG